MRLKRFYGRPRLFVRKDQNIFISKEWKGCPQAILFSEKQNQVTYNIIKKITQLFNDLFFQNNYLKKKHISQKTKLKYTCLKCLFL